MAGVTVRMDDLNRLVATLTDKTDGMDSRSSLIVRKAAHDVEAYAKQYVPVDTGFLKNSIHTVITANKWRVYAADVIADAFYANFVESGTSRMSPQPFMGPALERVTPGFLAALEQIAGNIV
jgi:HK97 gp10 family phage protein